MGIAVALRIAGVADAVLLGEQGTASTGLMRFFRARGNTLFGTDGITNVLRPVELAQGAGSALVLVPRSPPPGAHLVDTFKGARVVR